MNSIFNYLLSLFIAIFVLPIILFFALLIYLYDRHNPFYVANRVGKNGKLFKMIKLRSMCVDSHKIPTVNTDPGITPIGKIIRKFKLDELAQIINVIKGDINIIGPRPQVEMEAERYTTVERRIFNVKPGISDIASIVFSDQGDILKESQDPYLLYAQIERPWKSRLALLYIEHASLVLDLKIMFYTFTNIFARQWTLDRLSKIVSQWPCDVDLSEIVARRIPLYAYPVPGADKIIEKL